MLKDEQNIPEGTVKLNKMFRLLFVFRMLVEKTDLSRINQCYMLQKKKKSCLRCALERLWMERDTYEIVETQNREQMRWQERKHPKEQESNSDR